MDATIWTELLSLPGTDSADGELPLRGMRFAVKDVIDVAGCRTGCGNPTFGASQPPAAAHAACVELLIAAGASCVGKTTTDELAFGLTGENAFSGSPPNPRAPARVTGGSSCGSASAVASGLVDFALGTDTGGSIRVPASHCGLWGYRPSHGRILTAGVRPLAPSFDTVGVLARDASLLEAIAHVLLGSAHLVEPPPKTVMLVEEAFAVADQEVRAAIESAARALAENLGATVETMSIREVDGEAQATLLEPWLASFRALQGAEIWSCLGAWVESANPSMGARTRANFDWARGVDRGELGPAWRWRQQVKTALHTRLSSTSLLCMPTTPCPAPLRGAAEVDRATGNYFPRVLSLTSLSGLAGLPEVTVPVAMVDGAPVGLSWIAGRGQDERLLRWTTRAGTVALPG